MTAYPESQRLALAVEYNGGEFFGWQSQKDPLTPGVQDALEKALSTVANQSIKVACAGRTDTGVHATHQVVHFDSEAQRTPRQWRLGCNANLPKGVKVRWAHVVGEDFHARFSATARRYVYCIDNQASAPAIFHGQLTWCRNPLNADLMHAEAQALVGEHDFSSFRAAGCQAKTPHRDLQEIIVRREKHIVSIEVQANAFLQHMVRNIAGVLMAVGSGRRPPGWCLDVLKACDRRQGGVTAPPDGLYFVGVKYPEEHELPSLSAGPSLWGVGDINLI